MWAVKKGAVDHIYKVHVPHDKSVRCSLLGTPKTGFCDSHIRITINLTNCKQRQLDYGLNMPFFRTVTVQVIPLIP